MFSVGRDQLLIGLMERRWVRRYKRADDELEG